jgi:hypothetical protein
MPSSSEMDQELEQEINSYKELISRARMGNAPSRVVNQNELILRLLNELREWRMAGHRILKSLKETK